MDTRKKLCLIVPVLKKGDHTHFAYFNDFLIEIKKNFDVYLIVEKQQSYFSDFFPVRLIRMASQIKYARFLGYRDFYVHYSFLGAFSASLAVKIFGGRVFYWNCGLPWQYQRNFFRDSFERLTYRLITFLVTGTEGMKKLYAEHYGLQPEKIKVMPNWINIERIKNYELGIRKDELLRKLDIKSDVKILLFAHRLSKRKGAHYLPEIAKRLNAVIPDSKFIILVIGDGPERKAIELKATSYKLQANFRFLGWVPNEELAAYYQLADVFLMPSEEEGFPHVILETMAAGTPFVAFNVGGVSEIIPPELKDYLIAPFDLDEFTAKVKDILAMDDLARKKIAEVEKEWVKRFDIHRVAEAFKGILFHV